MRHAFADAYIHSDGNGNSHVHSDGDCDGNTYANSDCNCDCNSYSNCNDECDPSATTYTDAAASADTAAAPLGFFGITGTREATREFPA